MSNEKEGRGAVYYINTGRPLPDFTKDKPPTSDKRKFFKGDWKSTWPRDFKAGVPVE